VLRRLIHYANYNPLVSGLLVLVISGGFSTLRLALKDPASKWFWKDAYVSWGGIAVIALVMLAALAAIIGLVSALRRERARTAARPQAPATFDPDSFALTALRCRALLWLLQRVEARIVLHDIHEAVQTYNYDGHHYVDTSQSRGRLQHDLEDAERAGIVRIERVRGGAANCYELTAQGRDWVLLNETLLKPLAAVDMTQADRPPRVRYT
jgi:hypothetical protein